MLGPRRLVPFLVAETADSLSHNVAAPLLHQLARMAGRIDPPAYVYLDGRESQATKAVDRFPLAKVGFTFACWSVARRRPGASARRRAATLIVRVARGPVSGTVAGSVLPHCGWRKRAWS